MSKLNNGKVDYQDKVTLNQVCGISDVTFKKLCNDLLQCIDGTESAKIKLMQEQGIELLGFNTFEPMIEHLKRTDLKMAYGIDEGNLMHWIAIGIAVGATQAKYNQRDRDRMIMDKLKQAKEMFMHLKDKPDVDPTLN